MNVTFVLVLLWPRFDSAAITSIPGFQSVSECLRAGAQIQSVKTDGVVSYTCVQQSRPTNPG